jgi:hypothetical protein
MAPWRKSIHWSACRNNESPSKLCLMMS